MERGYTFQYETETNSSFLVAILNSDVKPVQYQMKMIEVNSVAHLLETRKYRENETVRICYDVTSKMTLAQVFSRQKMRKEEVLTLLEGLLESYRELPEYQLPAQGLLLDEDYIFVRPGSFEPNFVYLPIYTEDGGTENLRQFVCRLILDSRITNTNDDFVQRLLELFNDPGATLTGLGEGVAKLKKQAARPQTPPLDPPQVIQPPVLTPPPQVSAAPPAPSAEEPVRLQKKEGSKQGKPSKKGKGTSKRSLLFAAVQAVVVLALAMLTRSGFFMLEEGGINLSYVGGILLLVGGLDLVLYRELFVNGGNKDKKAKAVKSKNKQTHGRKEKGAAARNERTKTSAQTARKPELSSAPQEPVMPTPVPEPEPEPAIPAYFPYVPVQPCGYPAADSGDDTVVDEGGVFGACYLEYFENGLTKRIHLREGVIRVGSRAQEVDYVISSNRVSKVHAEFVRQGERCFVRDINSTNGTYINDSRDRIVSNCDMELHPGDKVRLANVEMILKC